MALTADGTRLAIGVTGGGHSGIEVISLNTGAVRAWASQVPGNPASLSWAGDATLAFLWWGQSPAGSGVRLLDTAEPGTDLMTSRLLIPKSAGQENVDSSLITQDGSKVFATVISLANQSPAAAVVEFSARTGNRIRALTPSAGESGHCT